MHIYYIEDFRVSTEMSHLFSTRFFSPSKGILAVEISFDRHNQSQFFGGGVTLTKTKNTDSIQKTLICVVYK